LFTVKDQLPVELAKPQSGDNRLLFRMKSTAVTVALQPIAALF